MKIISELISGILQVFLFALIPLIFYVYKYRKINGFSNYIGLKKPQLRTILYGIIIAILFVISTHLVFQMFDLIEYIKSPETVPGGIRELGFGAEAIIVLLIKSIITTGLSEEILFRGFILKRLSEKLGFAYGNLMQAFIFGLLHGVLLFGLNIIAALIMVLVSGIVAYLFGYLNERLGNGSIAPSWAAHSLGNIVSFSLIAFIL